MDQVNYLKILRLWAVKYSKNRISNSVHSSHHTVEELLQLQPQPESPGHWMTISPTRTSRGFSFRKAGVCFSVYRLDLQRSIANRYNMKKDGMQKGFVGSCVYGRNRKRKRISKPHQKMQGFTWSWRPVQRASAMSVTTAYCCSGNQRLLR